MQFTIENSYVLGLASWLSEQSYEGKVSRARSRLVKALAERHTETDNFRKEIINKYAQKDEKGELFVENGNYKIENIEEFQKEIRELYLDTLTISLDSGDATVLKHAVLNTSYKFGPKEGDSEEEKVAKMRQANDYVEWCKSFEEMKK